MINVNGVWLPDNETHMQEFLLWKANVVGGIGTYQLDKINLALSLCKDFRVALDIGSHVGTWTRLLSMRFDKVICFEPNPDAIKCFHRNIEDWKIDNSEIHEVALGEFEKDAFLLQSPDNTGGSRISGSGVPCKMKTLDSFEVGDVDFIKVDCEGYEYFVLRGGEKLIKRTKPLIVVEQKKADNYDIGDMAACKLLESWGAKRLGKIVGDYYYGWQ